MGVAKPDVHGRYRVIDKSTGHEYSTRNYLPDGHKVAVGPASDVSGNPVASVHNPKVASLKAPAVEDSPKRVTAIVKATTNDGQEAKHNG